jgi:hypothetical protein
MCRAPIGIIVALVAASLALGACSSSSKSSSAHVATSAASTRLSTATSGNTANSVVSIAPAARSDSRAPAIAAVLTRHYMDINQEDFADYWTMYTPEYRASFNKPKVEAGYRSSADSHIRLTELSTTVDGRLAATVTFTSTQDAADGPNGQICTDWTVGYFFKKVGLKYLIDTPPNSYHSTHAAC